jgi:hypothetical protein
MPYSYASRTTVPVEKTRMEIERLVKRYGAKGFASGWQGGIVRVEFLASERHIRISVLVPDNKPQVARTKWRAMLLVIKAKLESVDAHISTFEQAFAADIVMPGTGKTVWETIREPIKLAYEGKSVALLGGPHG